MDELRGQAKSTEASLSEDLKAGKVTLSTLIKNASNALAATIGAQDPTLIPQLEEKLFPDVLGELKTESKEAKDKLRKALDVTDDRSDKSYTGGEPRKDPVDGTSGKDSFWSRPSANTQKLFPSGIC